MRLKDIFWPWGAVKERDELTSTNSLLEWNVEFLSRMAKIDRDRMKEERHREIREMQFLATHGGTIETPDGERALIITAGEEERRERVVANLRSECIRLHGEVERLHDAKAKALATHYEFRNSIIEAVNRDMQNDLNPRIGDGLSYGNEVRYTYGMPGPIRGVVR